MGSGAPGRYAGHSPGPSRERGALLPQAEPVFDEVTALDTAGDRLEPQPTRVERLVRPGLRQRECLAARLLGRHEDRHLGQRARQEAQILQEPVRRGPGRRGAFSDTLRVHMHCRGLAEEEEREESIDQEDIFDCVIFFLAATTLFAQFIAVCSALILVETLGYASSFSSPLREKRRVLVWRKPLLTDQLQPSTNSDKLSDEGLLDYRSTRGPCRVDNRRSIILNVISLGDQEGVGRGWATNPFKPS